MPCDNQSSLLYRSSLSASSRINSIRLRGQYLGRKIRSVFIRIVKYANWMHPICTLCLVMRTTFSADGKKQLNLGMWKWWKNKKFPTSNKTGQLLASVNKKKIIEVILNPKSQCSFIFRDTQVRFSIWILLLRCISNNIYYLAPFFFTILYKECLNTSPITNVAQINTITSV